MLISGKTKSCGCLQRETTSKRRITQEKKGTRCGILTIIEFDRIESGKVFWKCRCDCGNTVSVPGVYLRSNNIKSCGCLRSYNEILIKNILEENNILYKKEFTFQDLRSEKGYPLRYGFAIFTSGQKLLFILEYDGEQHKFPVEAWDGEKQERFYQRKKHDKLKTEYCLQNNIPLLRLDKKNDRTLQKDILQFYSNLLKKE